jgi:CheY-like chemotaxis protein
MTDALILLVDDEPNIIELTQLYLEREGYRKYRTIPVVKAVDRTVLMNRME